MLAQQQGIHVGAQRVDVVHQQMAQRRALGQQPGKHAVAQQVRHLIPVADGMQTLRRQVVGVVAALARLLRPVDQRGVQALAHLLRLLVEQLLRHLLPGKAQVARHGDEAQPHRPPRREQQRAGIAGIPRPRQKVGDRRVRQVAGSDDVRDRRARQRAGAAALGQVHLDEVAVLAAHAGKGIERLDHAGALGPATAGAARQRHHRHRAIRQRVHAERAQLLRLALGKPRYVHDIARRHILDRGAHRQPVLRQADAPAAQVGADLLVLHAVEAVGVEQRRERLLAAILAVALRQQAVEERLHHAGQRRLRACGCAKGIQLGAAEGGECALFVAQQARHRQRIVAGGHERLLPREQLRPRAALVDGKVVDDRVHGKGHGTLQFALGRAHHLL